MHEQGAAFGDADGRARFVGRFARQGAMAGRGPQTHLLPGQHIALRIGGLQGGEAQRLEADLRYTREASLWLDLKICWWTVRRLTGQGAN